MSLKTSDNSVKCTCNDTRLISAMIFKNMVKFLVPSPIA